MLPEPPGTACDAHADLLGWRSVASFGHRYGEVDRLAAGRYPLLPLAGGHAARVVMEAAGTGPRPAPMTATRAIEVLRHSGSALGLLVG